MTAKRTKLKVVSDLLFCVALTSIFGEVAGRFVDLIDVASIDVAGILQVVIWISSRVTGALVGLYAWSIICPLNVADYRVPAARDS